MIFSLLSLLFSVCCFCLHHLRLLSPPSAFIILRFFPSPNLSFSLLCHLFLPALLSFSLPSSIVSSVAPAYLFPWFSVSSFHLCCSPISFPILPPHGQLLLKQSFLSKVEKVEQIGQAIIRLDVHTTYLHTNIHRKRERERERALQRSASVPQKQKL